MRERSFNYWPTRSGVRERCLAIVAALPFLAVPFFVAPIGRFALPALPAIAWGLGSLGSNLVDVAGDRHRRMAQAGTAVAAVWLVLSGASDSWVITGPGRTSGRR